MKILTCLALLVSLNGFAFTTSAEQKRLTPAQVLQDLTEGNARFVAGRSSTKNWPLEVSQSAAGQFPKAVILSCLDSRVPVETVFDQGMGDVFVARVAGNVVGDQTLGSLEFATQVAGARLILVLGHESCGAVKGAIADVKLGHLGSVLEEIRPAVEKTRQQSPKSMGEKEFLDSVIRENIVQAVAAIRKQSPILQGLEQSGAIAIVGGYYDLHSGKVTLLEPTAK